MPINFLAEEWATETSVMAFMKCLDMLLVYLIG